MKVLLEYPPDSGIPDEVKEVLDAPPAFAAVPVNELRFGYFCSGCGLQHFTVFRPTGRVRLHDDGTLKVYGLVGIE